VEAGHAPARLLQLTTPMVSAGQKRTAASSSSDPHKSKKTRFVDPADDPTNFAEQVDSALEQTSRRGKVKNEGYESDSSDDGEGVVNSRKKQHGPDEDDDMFAPTEKEENEESGKKQDKFMRLGDIEGQEFGSRSGSDSESDIDEPADQDEAERRKKEGMGFELSSFNMRDEMEEGKFTEDGSYVRTFDPHSVHDRWMEGLDDREIQLARRRKRYQEKLQREKIEAEEKELQDFGGQDAMERELLPLLKKGETVLEALQRLGSRTKKPQKNEGCQSHSLLNRHMDIDKSHNGPTDIEQITHLASSLMSLGDTDIYSKTYEEIVRSVRSSGKVEPSWEPPSADIKYEYKWSSPAAGQTTETFGPFAEEELKSWFNALYFGPAGEKVHVRSVDGEWGSWQEIVQ
jgi:CD2 antigen cytoplasmic tail-binding protein 2